MPDSRGYRLRPGASSLTGSGAEHRAPPQRGQFEHHRGPRDTSRRHVSSSRAVAASVPPVASTSSMIMIVAAGQVDAVGGDLQRGRCRTRGRRSRCTPAAATCRPCGRPARRCRAGRHRPAEQEAPGVDAGDQVGAGGDLGHRVGHRGKAARSANTGVRSLNWMPGDRESPRPRGSTTRSAPDVLAHCVIAPAPIGPCSIPRPSGSDCCSPRTSSSTSAGCAAGGRGATSACRPTVPARPRASSRASSFGSAVTASASMMPSTCAVGVARQVVAVAGVQVVGVHRRRSRRTAAGGAAGAGQQHVDLAVPQRLRPGGVRRRLLHRDAGRRARTWRWPRRWRPAGHWVPGSRSAPPAAPAHAPRGRRRGSRLVN